MSTITKERIEQFANDPMMCVSDEVRELARIALASLEAEPALYAADETLAYAKMGELHLTCISEPMGDAVIPLYTAPPALQEHRKSEAAPVGYYRKGSDGFYFASPTEQRPGTVPLYAAPPVPVVPDECRDAPAYVKALTKVGAYIYGFNACRAAMLHG